MAFPVVQTADTKSGTVTSNSTSWTLTYPTNIAAGDLLLALIAIDGSGGYAAFPSGWVVWSVSDTNTGLIMGKKSATGSESGNFTVSTNSEQGGWRVFRITGWGGTLGTSWINDATAGDVLTTPLLFGASGTSTTPDPPSLNPINWDAEDTLWVAAISVDASRTVSAFPSNYTTTSSDVSGGATGATLATCFRDLNAASEDPGTFTISNSDDWVANTIAIRPAAAVDLGPNPWDTLGIPIR